MTAHSEAFRKGLERATVGALVCKLVEPDLEKIVEVLRLGKR